MSGRNEKIAVASRPPGAQVLVDEKEVGPTPLVTKVKRGKRHEIVLKKEGYLDDSRITNKAFNWWFAGNLLIGGLIGMTTDFITGAVYKVDPNTFDVNLIEAPRSAVPEELGGPAPEEAPGDEPVEKGRDPGGE